MFWVYCINMVPAFILILLADELILKNIKSTYLYLGSSIITLILMYMLLAKEYDNLYSTTYEESANLRIGIAETLSKLPLSYFSKHDLSDISQTIMADVEMVEHAMSHAIPKVGAMVLFFPLIGIMLMVGNIKMGFAVIVPTILSFILIPIAKKSQVKANKKYHKVLRENSEQFQETIELQQEISSFNLSNEVRNSLYKKMEDSERIHLKVEQGTIFVLGISSLFAFVSIAVVSLVGMNLILSGEIDILYLIGYLMAAIKIKDIFDLSKEGLLEVFFIDPSVERIREIKETKIQEGKDVELNMFDIVFKNVAFSYEDDNEVLKDISFTAKQGEVTALVGASGSGKTSILRLISRLYDYDKGEILIDGKDIKNISTDSLFKKTSIVFQDVTLFNTSILENIRIGKKDASDEEVKRAAIFANCMDFIEKLPKGFDTVIGENGAELSGGERQRLSIARAFLKDAPILILDEISASLDVDNEKKIQESLNKLIKDKTVIIISHRLKSIENVDKIVILENGYVESIGGHKELLGKSKLYNDLLEKTRLAEEFVY
ncbi:ABC transporter ATP-binding protein [Staphylococcus lugdunensis]|uniref:ABC transporter ATP-binding protein n=2 Tax=Staphylococcus lugdunensis TaxID=28035 RepID=UPI001D013E5D|nr:MULTISPECIES: ABC transporter ATP-binding protein [Staphylococcus]MCH8655099.1 ABC transporter ATP-binding protein/permease [Staphylococcus lugdunensis]MCH8662317.1 ABC transporter ATP-binding protein/permease [Staphylococcus lugdunensis]MCH8683670.1 ABC transporter ATP-binding protein/permease [Staphylococcus lugdunensis]MCI2227492.1 ABC transporter ATP-binding protein/permease [Staphylococcus lugdunensis]MCI2751220.1 ABC transporter ATP-binding protein/permease [Staphylococcus lugdunensis